MDEREYILHLAVPPPIPFQTLNPKPLTLIPKP